MSNDTQTAAQDTTPADLPRQPALAGLAMEGAAFVPTAQAFTRDGRPVRRFLKDMIAEGVYRHPSQGWTLEVTGERMDRWVAAFQQMRLNGVDVEVVVDHRLDAEATRGYVVDMFRWGRKLYGVHELIGEDAIALAARVKNVSVLIEKDFIDGRQRSYGEAITHSSIVQKPIVPGQQEFLPIAASGNSSQRPLEVLVLDPPAGAAGEGGLPPGETFGESDLKELQAALGAAEPLTGRGAVAAVRQEIDSLRRQNEELRGQVSQLSDRLAAEQGKPLAERIASSLADPEILDGLAQTAEDRIEALVAGGRMTPAVAAGLKGLLVGAPGRRNAYALSRKASGTEESLVRGVIRVLEQNQPLPLGERTGGQYMALCRAVPGQEPPAVNPQTTREMIGMASGQKTGP